MHLIWFFPVCLIILDFMVVEADKDATEGILRQEKI